MLVLEIRKTFSFYDIFIRLFSLINSGTYCVLFQLCILDNPTQLPLLSKKTTVEALKLTSPSDSIGSLFF